MLVTTILIQENRSRKHTKVQSGRTLMGRRGQSITLSITDRQKQQLEAIATEFGMNWGDKPNISKLVKAIADHTLRIAPNHDWDNQRIQAIDQARKVLIDLGKLDEARILAQILLERSELTLPFRAEIETFLHKPFPVWRQTLDRFIRQQQPFRLTYQDASDRLWQFTVLHAQIRAIEKREYLCCRCEESTDNNDIPELCHNWTLRLDRIPEAAVSEIEHFWLSDLESITVECHLYRQLAFSYERKPNDIEVGEMEGDPPFRRIVKKIDNTFWFYREIARYWDNCAIIAPQNLRDQFLEKLNILHRTYNNLY